MSDGYGYSAIAPITREQSVRLIVQTCLEEGVTDERQIAYVLATAAHESRNFTSLEEDYGRKQAVEKGYMGGEREGRGSGEEYFGRGYVHLTHYPNYRTLGAALGRGTELVDEPELAADPETAARVLVVGMRDGLFTERGLGDYINADTSDYRNARRIVNGTDRAVEIAVLARNWEPEVAGLVTAVQRDRVDLTPTTPAGEPDAVLQRGSASARAFELQQYLVVLNITNRAGRPLSPDGDFGPSTEQAVSHYQRLVGIDPQTGVVDEALFERIRSEALESDPSFQVKTIMDLYGPLSDRVLGPGDRGDAVAELQEQLRGLGARGPDGALKVSRRYDVETEAAVRRFQSDENIVPANGLADEETRDAINARAVDMGLPVTVDALRRRDAVQSPLPTREEAGQEAGRPVEDRQSLLQPRSGPFNDPTADRYLLAVLAGNPDLVDRIAIEFSEASDRRQLAQLGDQLLAQQQALEEQQMAERQGAQHAAALHM